MTTRLGTNLLTGDRNSRGRSVVMLVLLGIGLVVLGVMVGRGNLFGSADSSSTRVAYEVTWREQSTQQKHVSGDMSACQSSELACRDAALSGQWITVPGPVVTKRDYVCANSLEEATRMAGEGVTVTGKILASADCKSAESGDGQD